MSGVTFFLLIVLATVLLVTVAASAFYTTRSKRTERLRDQFGPEYDHTVAQTGDRREAETRLRLREMRHRELALKALGPAQRERFELRWTHVQGEFVDDPARAVGDADHLVTEVMYARGYPVQDFDQRAEDLSVRYPRLVQDYRAARAVARANERGEAGAEQLRHAVSSYRSLLEALLSDRDTDPPRDPRG